MQQLRGPETLESQAVVCKPQEKKLAACTPGPRPFRHDVGPGIPEISQARDSYSFARAANWIASRACSWDAFRCHTSGCTLRSRILDCTVSWLGRQLGPRHTLMLHYAKAAFLSRGVLASNAKRSTVSHKHPAYKQRRKNRNRIRNHYHKSSAQCHHHRH